MKINTCLIVDVWEGQLEIDESVLRANGVAGMVIRLNDMNGGHHMDAGFDKQWAEAVNFVRFPYFVYNPWVDGSANYAWLAAHMPAGVKTVAIDIEVRYSAVTPAAYTREVNKFLDLVKTQWKPIIYTGQWFLQNLSSWPSNVEYWWAQYPDPGSYFGGVTTWDELKIRLNNLDKPFNSSYIPGPLKIWQFTGDYLSLPGTARKIDVNLFYGSEADLRAWAGEDGPVNPPMPIESKYYYIKDDLWAGVPPRPFVRDGLPSTVRLRGGKGFVMLTAAWMGYVARINTSQAYNYIFKPASGWHNTGDINRVEQLTFSGNIVEVTRIEGERAYIKSFGVSALPPEEAIMPTDWAFHPLVQLFSTQYKTWLDLSTGGRWPRTLIIANPGEDLWINTADIAPFYPVDRQVTVKALPWLNVRCAPSTGAAIVSKLLYGARVTVRQLVFLGNDVWGHTVSGGWIALRYNGQWFTDWKV